MEAKATVGIPRAFINLPEPRHHNFRHKLIDILTIALFAVICGAEDWVAVAWWGRQREQWLRTFLELPYGIPSHDTFTDVFSRLDPDAFEACFQAWMASLVELSGGKLVAIDGKSIRRAFESAWDRSGMPHMVSAFVEANNMVFAQYKTDGKGQELSAIEKLLDLLDLKGTVISIDALGCQKTVTQKATARGADYVLQVKENQPTLLMAIENMMAQGRLNDFKGLCSDRFEQTEKGHGRIETRRLWVCWNVELLGEVAEGWEGLKCVATMQRTRILNGHKSVELHHYICSLDARHTAVQLAGYIRRHWSVENNLHWQLDVSFNEDQSRIRKGHGAENFSRLNRIALNLLKREKTAKMGIKNKRKGCGWSDDYLLKVVAS
jgi:predicted transposase YbfD/YdcC